MERPSCTCFQKMGGTGDNFVETAGAALFRSLDEFLDGMPACPESRDYMVSQILGGMLLVNAAYRQHREMVAGTRVANHYDLDTLRGQAQAILDALPAALQVRLDYLAASQMQTEGSA